MITGICEYLFIRAIAATNLNERQVIKDVLEEKRGTSRNRRKG